ncbi:hypothetical protein Barb6XT_02779 [Bacteroidales bacterium Barb6XT]|nr:hypothetical protein Barb6XT_02779 [Bacteroidales bacterium Barb6XT]
MVLFRQKIAFQKGTVMVVPVILVKTAVGYQQLFALKISRFCTSFFLCQILFNGLQLIFSRPAEFDAVQVGGIVNHTDADIEQAARQHQGVQMAVVRKGTVADRHKSVVSAEIKGARPCIFESLRADDGKGFALRAVNRFNIRTGKSPFGDKVQAGRKFEISQSLYVLQRLLFNKENRVEYRIIVKGGRIKSFPFIRYLFDGIIVRLCFLMHETSQRPILIYLKAIIVFVFQFAYCPCMFTDIIRILFIHPSQDTGHDQHGYKSD